MPTNRELAETDPYFIAACRKAGVPNTREEYRKWRAQRGIAFRATVGMSVDTAATSTVQRLTI
jgi:hypothetical protein